MMLNIVQASKCQSCQRTGELLLSERFRYPKTGEILDRAVYRCPETLCLHYDYRWLVVSDLRGNVPIREYGPRGVDKEFPQMTPEKLSNARIALENALGREYDRDNPYPNNERNE